MVLSILYTVAWFVGKRVFTRTYDYFWPSSQVKRITELENHVSELENEVHVLESVNTSNV